MRADSPAPAVCTAPPTDYQSLPSVTGPGDVKVDLDLGIGPGVGVDNTSLCFRNGSLPAAPVIRIKQGNRLTIHLTNTLWNSGPDNTENCDIENYVGGPPVSKTCSQPEQGFKAGPGPNGSFYPIQTNIPHLSDGTTNLHVHGLEVSPQPCSDNVLQSVLVAANWNGPLPAQLTCQNAPNELTYSYDIAPNHPTGLYFYHTHMHGQALAQTMMGASGAIVIEGEDDVRREKLGISDDVMIVRDIPSAYVPGETTPLVPAVKLAAASVTPPAAPAGRNWFPTVDPRIDRENIAGCPADLPDVGGPAVTRLTLNGALVNETAAFPPPDDKVLVKTMAAGERQLWRLVNASAQTYISPQLVLSQNGKTSILPLEIVALDGAPVYDNEGHRRIDRVDTTKKPLLLATANRVEFLVDAPPPGATLYLDTTQVTPGCAADGIPARRLLRVVSTGAPASTSAPPDAAALLPATQDPTYAHMLDVEPAVKRVFAFMEYPRGFTVSKSQWIVGPPGKGQFNPNSTDFFLTMIQSTDGQGQPVAIRPFVPDSPPDVVVHLKGKDSAVEEWTIQNYTLEVHPFHMHQMHFRDVTEADAIDGRAPILDTINIPPASRRASSSQPGVDTPDLPGEVRLRMKFTREMVGDFVFHCHILAHEDKGMMQKIRVVAD
ncbi:multicopper oxidase domain-containing protein [Starkeya sp. ORNL1]|uniref:multicopper oxidase family protein n=1 Tax=Starkeya sp. ORNL1 TaxID=2709380 RepID=UPI0014638C8D|nr:multicopper oxidase domain-containing protein [Starkeya sp. ORNL1]QJP13552.1 multicopper oxidase domain-containing protein [Starkeya sp. ORNL1]